MSLPNGVDPLDRLRAADPTPADAVPDASLARVQAMVQEHIMSDTQYDPTVPPTRGPLARIAGLAIAGGLVLAIAIGSGFNLGSPGGAPTDDPGGGGGMASCIAYDPATLPTMEIVFDGTVTAVNGDQVTFDVNEGWKGAAGSITLTAPDEAIALTGPLPAFEVGGRYLVTAAGTTINSCGYTLNYDAGTAADWAAAF